MKKIKFTLALATLAAALVVNTSCKKEEDTTPTPTPQGKTIAQVATDNPDFSILVDALTRTNLVDAVNDENASLTVFAPTNAAFADLLTELGLADLDAVENAIGTAGLRTVLLYHVLGAEVPSNAVTTGYANTLGTNAASNPLSLYISTQSGVRINNRANVVLPDVAAINGVVHVIDKVILPMSIYQLLEVNPDFSSLVTALGVADGNLDALMSDAQSGPFTLFAPNNTAFADALVELNIADLPTLVSTLGTDGVAEVLTYHVVSGNVRSSDVAAGNVATVNGCDITIAVNGGVTITDANSRTAMVTAVDIQGTNGVIHIINKVLLP